MLNFINQKKNKKKKKLKLYFIGIIIVNKHKDIKVFLGEIIEKFAERYLQSTIKEKKAKGFCNENRLRKDNLCSKQHCDMI